MLNLLNFLINFSKLAVATLQNFDFVDPMRVRFVEIIESLIDIFSKIEIIPLGNIHWCEYISYNLLEMINTNKSMFILVQLSEVIGVQEAFSHFSLLYEGFSFESVVYHFLSCFLNIFLSVFTRKVFQGILVSR